MRRSTSITINLSSFLSPSSSSSSQQQAATINSNTTTTTIASSTSSSNIHSTHSDHPSSSSTNNTSSSMLPHHHRDTIDSPTNGTNNNNNHHHQAEKVPFIQPCNQLHPPFRFRCIAQNIFVGGYPTLRNLRYLKRLKLKTIISLIPEKPITDLKDFCEYENIKIHHIYTQKYKEQVSFSFSEVSTIIEMFLNSKYHPIYCHCLDGTQVCSVLVMCFRKLQNWSKGAMKNELSRYTSELSTEDFDFVKQWKGPIKIDKRYLPDWVKASSAIIQLLVTDEKKKKKHGSGKSSTAISTTQEDDEHVLKHASGIKIVVEGYEELPKHASTNIAQFSPSHASISINSKGLLTPKKTGTPTVDIVKAINSKSNKPREAKSADSVTSPAGDQEADFLKDNIPQDSIPSFVETQHIVSKKEKPSLQIRGLDLGYNSERQRQQLIVWKNKKLTFRDLELPEDVEEYLDEMDDPFIYDEYLSFLTTDQ